MSQEFDPNNIAIPNGNIFGFPVTEEEAEIVIVPVPWDVTASYGKGTANGHPGSFGCFPSIGFLSSVKVQCTPY